MILFTFANQNLHLMKNILLCCLMFAAVTANSQNLIAVNHNGSSSFYTNIDTAIIKAANGDTIYLPGGVFTLNTSISKELHIYGAGLHPDSAKTTTPTIIIGNINLERGASNGTLEGIYTQNAIYLGAYGHSDTTKLNVKNYTISRCYLAHITAYSFYNSTYGLSFYDKSQYITIAESILTSGVYMLSSNKNFLISNCIISFYFSLYSSEISNCIFTHNSTSISGDNVLIKNCIAYGNSGTPSNSVAYNNVNPPYGNGYNGTLYLQGNFSANWSDIFVSVPVGAREDYFKNDYHLKSNFAGKNYGTDGTDVGIYGGPFPWKEGNVPVNPHIYFKDIPQVTDNAGKLPVKIKVKAQTR